MAPLVQLSGLVQRYEALDRADVPEVLRGVDLEVGDGESIAVVGPSGSGKSTLLNVIGGLLPPSEGKVLFEGKDLAAMSPDDTAALRNRSIGFVFQFHHLLPQCSALENVLLPTLVDLDPSKRRQVLERARALLDEVGLANRAEHRPAQLSGGECQRVAVVRALINEPRLLLADEPTGSLDSRSAWHLGEILCKLNEEKSVALVTVTHSERLAQRMKRIYELQAGLLLERQRS